jgi:hypothetical protein
LPASRLRHSSGSDPRGPDESLAERPPQPAQPAPGHDGLDQAGVGAVLALQRSAGNAAVSALLARAPGATVTETPAAKLTKLLQDDDEEGAIAFLASVTVTEAGNLLADPTLQGLAVKCFDDEEMARAMAGLPKGVRLIQRLNWMWAEGSNLGLVWPLLVDKDLSAQQKLEVYDRTYLRDFFADICDDDEMASVVRVLGGTLEQKLGWMLYEGTNWKAVRGLIADPAVDAKEKLKLYESKDIRNRMTDTLSHAQILEAVGILGGNLSQKLNWLYVEDTKWSTVKSLLLDPKLPAGEKTALYGQGWALKLFVEVCDDEEMAEAVLILGGKPEQQLRWMIEEGFNAKLIFNFARSIPDADLWTGGLPQEFKVALRKELSGSDYQHAEQMLTKGLLNWGTVDEKHDETHYELKDESDATKGYKLKDFEVHSHYDIEYARTELRIKVRIKLTGETPDNQHLGIWRTGIENKWNNKFHIENGKRIPIVVEPQFNAPSAHHSVEIHKGPPVAREDASNWTAGPNHDTAAGTQDTTDGDTASHEFGHLVGMDDEYNLTAADFQKYTGAAPVGPMPADGYDTTSVMGGSVTGPVEGRHMRPFVDWLNRNKLPGEKPYRLVAGP